MATEILSWRPDKSCGLSIFNFCHHGLEATIAEPLRRPRHAPFSPFAFLPWNCNHGNEPGSFPFWLPWQPKEAASSECMLLWLFYVGIDQFVMPPLPPALERPYLNYFMFPFPTDCQQNSVLWLKQALLSFCSFDPRFASRP